MKKNILLACLSIAMLASCGGPVSESTSKVDTENDSTNLEEVIAQFKKEVKTTVSFTYKANYKVDVISEKGGLDSFKQDVADNTSGEIDLTSGSLYLHVLKQTKAGEKSEGLVYKNGEDYYCLTNTMGEAAKLENETKALEKIDELLTKTSYSKAGSMSLSTLLYSGVATYEYTQFGLSSGNIDESYFGENKVLTALDNGGVKIESSSSYIGYNTDAGVSDFPADKRTDASNEKAGAYVVTTTKDGYVTSYKETMDAALSMPIMEPAPLVTIDGTREFAATYGEAITKLSEIDHSVAKATITIPAPAKGFVQAYVTDKVGGERKAIYDGAEVNVGQYLALKVTPAKKNTIKMVSLNQVSKEAPETDGFYYFEVVDTASKVNVNYEGSDVFDSHLVLPTDLQGCQVTAMTCVPMGFAAMAPANAEKLIYGNWLCLQVTAPKGKTLKNVTVNGKNPMIPASGAGGFWCYTIVDGANTVAITLE